MVVQRPHVGLLGVLLPGLWLFTPGSSRVSPEQDISAVRAHHLSCTGGLDNNYWERLKKIIIK